MALISVALAASRFLGISEQRTYELIRIGIIPPGVAVRLGRQVRLDEDGLRDWIKAGGQALPGGWKRAADEPSPFASPPTLPKLSSGNAPGARHRGDRHHD